jgi:activator of 2-hydroxyglutaryl-CoA dehydratase
MEFRQRHSEHTVPSAPLESYSGPCYLGIDAGSTTIKAVLLSEDTKKYCFPITKTMKAALCRPQKKSFHIFTRIYQLALSSPVPAFTGYGEAAC